MRCSPIFGQDLAQFIPITGDVEGAQREAALAAVWHALRACHDAARAPLGAAAGRELSLRLGRDGATAAG